VTRWIAGAGAFVVSLDSMVNIAFPAMAAWFERPPEAMRWVIIGYVLTYSLMSFAGGALADRIGLDRVFRIGLGLSAAAYVLAASAPAFGWLIAGRVAQGLAGGMIYGTAPGLITLAATPGARGQALGFLTASIGLASATGPVVAGAMVQAFGWQAVFAARVPVALLVLAWAWQSLPGATAATAYRIVGVRDLVRGPVLRACALSFLANAAIFAIWLLGPFYLVDRRGLDAFTGGLLFMLAPLGTALAAPIGGRIADRLGTRLPVLLGLALETAGLAAMSQAAEGTPLALVAAALFAAGFGVGLFQVPNMTVVMSAFPAGQQGAAGGLAFMARTLGVVTGVATLASVFAARRASAGFESAFTAAFLVATAVVGAATLAAALTARARGSGSLVR
jgi:MFS family permease